jgi:hypothetical protein
MVLRLHILQALKWLVIAALAAAVAYGAFRGYMSPDLLIGFANGFLC